MPEDWDCPFRHEESARSAGMVEREADRFSAAQTADPVALVQLYHVPVSGDGREAQRTELVAMLRLWR
jgi:hypothetical protein